MLVADGSALVQVGGYKETGKSRVAKGRGYL